jgi:hypothetical protein
VPPIQFEEEIDKSKKPLPKKLEKTLKELENLKIEGFD